MVCSCVAPPDVAQAEYSHSGLISAGAINGNGAATALFEGASADGTRVFFTTSEMLTTDDNTDSSTDVYERSGGITKLVSAGEINGDGAFTAVFDGSSADGTRVFFRTSEKLTTDDNTDSSADVYERSGGVTKLISKGAINGDGAFAVSFGGASADGTRVFFKTSEKLTTDDNVDSSTDVYERSDGTTRLISKGAINGDGAFNVDSVGFSADGSHAYFTTSEKLTTDDVDSVTDIYERSGTVTTRASQGAINGNLAFAVNFSAASADGNHVFFTTSEQLTSGDTDNASDIYDRSGNVTTLVSTGPIGGNGAFAALFGATTADGTRAFFATDEKLSNDDNIDSSRDIYMWSAGVTTLVSSGAINGNGAFPSFFGGASSDGSRVFFNTDEKLTTEDLDDSSDIYERSGGVTTLVSRGVINGNGAFNADAQQASADGTRYFFTTSEKLSAEDEDSSLDTYEATVEGAGFAVAGSLSAEAGGVATLTVGLVRPAPGPITVDYAISGGTAGNADRTLAPGTLTFDPGETSKTIEVIVAQDGLDEPGETVLVALSNPQNTALGAIATHTLTIVDDDTTVGFGAATSSVREKAGPAALQVTLSDPVTGNVEIGYVLRGGTAFSGKDFVLTAGTLTFPPGTVTRTLPLVVKQDFLVESPETVVVRLFSPSGAQPGIFTHTLTLTDDEPHNLKCGGKPATIVGSNGANGLTGSARADVIVGRGGTDTVRGLGGNDRLCGSGGADALLGGGGNDVVEGGLGNDTLKGDGGRDALKGQGGKDRLAGGAGSGDACDGGPGVDALLAGHGCETVAGVP